MRLQQIKQLIAAMETLSACADIDALLPTLLTHARNLCRAEAAWSWLIVGTEQLQLQHVEGVVAPSHLRQFMMPASGSRAIALRLRRLGYRSILVLPLQRGARISGMVAIGSRYPKRLTRTKAEMCRLLVQHACILFDRAQGQSPSDSSAQLPHEGMLSPALVQREHLHLLNILISRITHGLNNTMATINGRVELLLNRPHDQSTMQHLGATLRAIAEASHLVRHIQALVSGQQGHGTVMVDLNQLVRDSLQIARATWFLEFRETRLPIDLTADLRPLPALPARGPDLRIAFLCLLRHAMDTLSPGSRLAIRTWTDSDEAGEIVFISIAEDTGQTTQEAQSSLPREEEGTGLLRAGAQTPDSRRALEFVETVVYNLSGHITVILNAAGGTTTTVKFDLRDLASYGS